MAVRAITFDFWFTLFRDERAEERQWQRAAALAEATGEDVDDCYDALELASKEFSRTHREDQRTLGPKDAVRLASRTLGVSLTWDVIDRLTEAFATAILDHSPVPIPGALEAVEQAARHVPAGLLSDTGYSPGSSLRQLLMRHDFLEHFSALTFSDEVGVSKPRPGMFEAVADKLGVRPAELLHIGDLEFSDIAGAHGVHAQAALFAGENPAWLGKTKADHVFESWDEFVHRLPALVEPDE